MSIGNFRRRITPELELEFKLRKSFDETQLSLTLISEGGRSSIGIEEATNLLRLLSMADTLHMATTLDSWHVPSGSHEVSTGLTEEEIDALLEEVTDDGK